MNIGSRCALALVSALACSAACGPGHASRSAPAFGVEAKAFLKNPVTVEVLPTQGHGPSREALQVLTKRLEENGQGVAAIHSSPDAPDARRFWSVEGLESLELARAGSVAPPSLVVLYVQGFLASDWGAGGLHYGPHSVVIFTDALRVDQEPGALVHELGHVLGLVSNRTHAAPYSAFHDVDPACVMYFKVTGSTAFCDTCKADLAATAR